MDFLGVPGSDLSLGDFGGLTVGVTEVCRFLVSAGGGSSAGSPAAVSPAAVSEARRALGTYTARSGRRGLAEPDLVRNIVLKFIA